MSHINPDFNVRAFNIIDATKEDFVTRSLNQYIQEDWTYSDLVNDLFYKLPIETKEDAVIRLLFHCLLEDWHTNGHLTGSLSEDYWISTISFPDYLPEGRTFRDIYAELVNKIAYDAERGVNISRHSSPNSFEVMVPSTKHSEGNHYGNQNTSRDQSRSSQSKQDKEKSTFEKYRDVLDFVREFVDKLSDQLGGSSGGDSSDNEDETESSENTATSDTTHVERQM